MAGSHTYEGNPKRLKTWSKMVLKQAKEKLGLYVYVCYISISNQTNMEIVITYQTSRRRPVRNHIIKVFGISSLELARLKAFEYFVNAYPRLEKYISNVK